jgi:ribosome-binding factor A
LKHHPRRRKPTAFENPDFAEALFGDSSGSSSADRQRERKTRQLCRQVQRALNLALAVRGTDSNLSDLYVEEVSPAPHCGHLLVHVAIPLGRPAGETLGALRREAPRLRAEVATAITRKRAPELSFVPAFPEGGDRE